MTILKARFYQTFLIKLDISTLMVDYLIKHQSDFNPVQCTRQLDLLAVIDEINKKSPVRYIIEYF